MTDTNKTKTVVRMEIPGKPLAGQMALVTGASAGIGAATAVRLAELGAAVVASARRKEKLDGLVTHIQQMGGTALALATDSADIAQIDHLLLTCEAWSKKIKCPLTIVVVNAGRGLAGGVTTSDESKWDYLYKLNVLGAAHLMRGAALHFVGQKRGDIVVLGSVSGHNISPFSGFYGSTKWAVAAIAESLRREVCGLGVRVTTIKPGIVESDFQDVAGYTHDNFHKSIERFGKVLVPSDVAQAIGFVVCQPQHVHINDLVIRPTGQDYP